MNDVVPSIWLYAITKGLKKQLLPLGALFFLFSIPNKAQGQLINLSRTLPILYIQTDSAREISSKEDYISASFWIDTQYASKYESVGSKNNPCRLQVKGRGNHTWKRFDKKPYKIKLDEKTKLLGLSKSKHFVLMAHADRDLAFLHDEIGFEVSRRMGMPWTVKQVPVELVLNGAYKGLYFLNEQIRVQNNRVNIKEQNNEETDIYKITGGWLLEIDQYREINQLEFVECNGEPLYVTYHSPEVLSSEQESYLRNLILSCDSCIYVQDKTSTAWEDLIDLELCAKFYLINEIMDNVEAYNGSCWFYKDRGEKEKLKFGPVWDFGYSVYAYNNKFIYVDYPYRMTWITELVKFPRFQEKVIDLWNDYYNKGLTDISEYVEFWTESIRKASVLDYEQWPQYGTANLDSARNVFLSLYNYKIDFLRQVWDGYSATTNIADNKELENYVLVKNGELIVAEEEKVLTITVYNLKGFREEIKRVSENRYRLQSHNHGVYLIYIELKDGKVLNFKVSI